RRSSRRSAACASRCTSRMRRWPACSTTSRSASSIMPENKVPVTAFLGLGGNVGDPVCSMAAALQALDAHPDCAVTGVSRLYRTPPWGKTDQDWFFNSDASVTTTLPPHALLELCLEIERSMKRVRTERWGPRTLDLDILVYGDWETSEDSLTLPHPR